MTLEPHWRTERGEKSKFIWLIGEIYPFLPRESRERPSALPAVHLSSPASSSPPADNTILQSSVLLVCSAERKPKHPQTKNHNKKMHLINPLHQARTGTMLYIKKKKKNFSSVQNVFSLGPWADTYLCVSYTSCSCKRLLRCLCFPSHCLIAVVLLWVSGDLCSPILAQQDVDDFCMALQSGMDQRTLATLISMAHLAQRDTQKDLQHWSWLVPVIRWPRSGLFMSSVSQNRSWNGGEYETRAV